MASRGGHENSLNDPPLSFLDAAQRVLNATRRPLNPKEITQLAVEMGILRTEGKTPSQTMKARLSDDILRYRRDSRFKRTGPNQFALREWPVEEYTAPRYKKALLEEEIVVFDRAHLREFFPSDGITALDAATGQALVARTYDMRRQDAEEDFGVIQLVSQFLVIHRHRIASHRRTRRLPESRLHGVRSLLFGGHLNRDDISPLMTPFDPDNGARFITRELSEEVEIYGAQASLTLIGGIYDPRSEVSQQHLGVLYSVHVPDESEIRIGERGFLQQLRFETVAELATSLDEYENWSELVFRTLLATGQIIP